MDYSEDPRGTTYSEDLRDHTLTPSETRRVIQDHGLSFNDFLADCYSGVTCPMNLDHDGETIANWLGY